MIITRLVKKGKNVIVEVDGTDEFLIREEIVYKAGLRKNDELNEEKLEGLIRQSSLIKIKEKALDLLSRRPHSSRELKTKLIKKGFDPVQIDSVIRELKEKRYLNDFEFAKLLAEEKIGKKKKGLNLVKKALIEKGIDRNIIDEILSSYANNEILYENALISAGKKIASLDYKNLTENELKNKVRRFLNSRGYDRDTIEKVINTKFSG